MASRGPGVRSHTGVPRVDFFYFFTIVLHLFTCLLAVPGLCCCPSSPGAAVSGGPSPAVVRRLLSAVASLLQTVGSSI